MSDDRPTRTPVSSAARLRRTAAATALVGAAVVAPVLLAGGPVAGARTAATDAQVDDGHRFLTIGPDGQPGRWDPCAVVPWVVDVASLPTPDAADDLVELVGAMTVHPELPTFAHLGTTTRSAEAEMRLPPDVRAPVEGGIVIGFGDPSAVVAGDPARAGDVIGLGGPSYELDGDTVWAVGGRILLDAAYWRRADLARRNDLLTHEMLHVLGLDHTTFEANVMASSYVRSRLGAGDLAGLRALADAPCR